jgi:hypothetical protein
VIKVKPSFPIPQKYSNLFRDTDLSSLDVVENRRFIIERILNMGDGNELGWLWSHYSEDDIRETVQNSRKLSKKLQDAGKTILA